MWPFIILICVSTGLVIVGIISYLNVSKILKKGIKAEGVIFSSRVSDSFNNINLSYPVVRFLTATDEWITETSTISLIPGFYKEGNKVTVMYDPENPKKFVLQSTSNKLMGVVLAIIGFILFIIGVYNLLNVYFKTISIEYPFSMSQVFLNRLKQSSHHISRIHFFLFVPKNQNYYWE